MATNSFLTANKVTVTDVPATTMTGQTATAQLASFHLGPQSSVGQRPATWRQHPNTVSGRVIKAR